MATIHLNLERACAQARMLGRNRALAERASNLEQNDSPLSGEWSGDPTPSSLGDYLGVDDTWDVGSIEAICESYEQAYAEAWEQGL